MQDGSMYGVETFDTEEVAVLVNADIDAVASELKNLKGATRHERDVFEETLKISDPSYLVIRMADCEWTVIAPCTSSPKNSLQTADAEELSRRLNARAVFFANSDCASYTEYELFESGTSRERFQCADDVKFTSEFRNMPPPEDGPDVYDFVNQFFQEIEAYLPPFSIELGAGNMRGGTKVQMSEDADELDEELVERVDYIG